MLVNMIDGGIVDYQDNCNSISGCPTCDYGSEYINRISVELTKFKIKIELNKMYDYALTEGQVMRMFLTNNDNIQKMTEKEFIGWFKQEIVGIVSGYVYEPKILRMFEITEI